MNFKTGIHQKQPGINHYTNKHVYTMCIHVYVYYTYTCIVNTHKHKQTCICGDQREHIPTLVDGKISAIQH